MADFYAGVEWQTLCVPLGFLIVHMKQHQNVQDGVPLLVWNMPVVTRLSVLAFLTLLGIDNAISPLRMGKMINVELSFHVYLILLLLFLHFFVHKVLQNQLAASQMVPFQIHWSYA